MGEQERGGRGRKASLQKIAAIHRSLLIRVQRCILRAWRIRVPSASPCMFTVIALCSLRNLVGLDFAACRKTGRNLMVALGRRNPPPFCHLFVISLSLRETTHRQECQLNPPHNFACSLLSVRFLPFRELTPEANQKSCLHLPCFNRQFHFALCLRAGSNAKPIVSKRRQYRPVVSPFPPDILGRSRKSKVGRPAEINYLEGVNA
jgi:hypothetical protein